MNLLQVRQWFIRESGRYDLVTDVSSWADNGANAYINAGQKMLDRRVDLRKSTGRHFANLAVGENVVAFQASRAIKEVWTFGSGVPRKKLILKDMQWLRSEYSDMENPENGVPEYYTPGIFRLAPDETMSATIGDLDVISGYLDLLVEDHFAYNGIVIFPPTDTAITVETWGLFYSQELSSDESNSFWSVVHPELLVMAAQCIVEQFNRNSEGVKDWMSSIDMALRDITNDFVEEEITDIVRLEG